LLNSTSDINIFKYLLRWSEWIISDAVSISCSKGWKTETEAEVKVVSGSPWLGP